VVQAGRAVDRVRKWYAHDPEKYAEFGRRYRAELDDPERAQAYAHLQELAGASRLTLLTASKRSDISEAAVLAELLNKVPTTPLVERQWSSCRDP